MQTFLTNQSWLRHKPSLRRVWLTLVRGGCRGRWHWGRPHGQELPCPGDSWLCCLKARFLPSPTTPALSTSSIQDTGATASIITFKMAKLLNLQIYRSGQSAVQVVESQLPGYGEHCLTLAAYAFIILHVRGFILNGCFYRWKSDYPEHEGSSHPA